MQRRGTTSRTGWAAAAVGAFAVLVVGWTGYELSQWPPEPPDAAATTSSEVTRQEPAQEPPAAEQAVALTVVGDSYAAGTGATQPQRTGFASLLGRCLGAPLTLRAEGGVGYLAQGSDAVAARVREAAKPGVVVVAAGIQDRPAVAGGVTAAQLRTVAGRAWAAAAEGGGEVVVVGPFWPADELTDPAIRTVRDALRAEAEERGLLFVDPTGWLEGRVGPDGAHPTQEGHRFVADRLAEALAEAGVASSSC